MNRHKKITILVCAFLTTLSIAACGKTKEDEFAPSQQESDIRTSESAESDIKDEIVNAEKSLGNQQENNVQTVENTDSEMAAEELLDLFISGSISAVDSTDLTSGFYITDLNMDSEEWDSYSIGEKVDLDNDGENELIICGPYGGIYLDARDNKVYKFAGGDGTALILSYTWYRGDIWIMYSNRSSTGIEFYHMEKYEGADNLVAEINFGEEFDINNAEAGLRYTLNGAEISYDEYTAFASKIFAAEVGTSLPPAKTSSSEPDGTDDGNHIFYRTGITDGDHGIKEDALENYIGEYDYSSDYETGKLMIQKTSDGYDICDYESESSYRFLADLSNVEAIENNMIYIKYPERVFSDGAVDFHYYILECREDDINVYHTNSVLDEARFLYRATKSLGY